MSPGKIDYLLAGGYDLHGGRALHGDGGGGRVLGFSLGLRLGQRVEKSGPPSTLNFVLLLLSPITHTFPLLRL